MKMNKPGEPVKDDDQDLMEQSRRTLMAFMRTVLSDPNIEKAAKLVETFAKQVFERVHTAKVTELTLEIEELDERANHASERLRELERQERNTPSYQTVPEIRKAGSRSICKSR